MINLTGKDIAIYSTDDVIKTPGRASTYQLRNSHQAPRPLVVFRSHGVVRPHSTVEYEEVAPGVKVLVQRYMSVDNPLGAVPTQVESSKFIVTNLFAGVARGLGLLDLEFYTIYGLVVDPETGRKVGCLGLEAK